MIVYSTRKNIDKTQLEALFLSVGWESGKYPDRLQTAVCGFDTVLSAWDGDLLVGLIAAMDDGALTAYVHYLLVRPSHQGRGIGGVLLEQLKAHYAAYHKIALIGEHPAAAFYRAHGFWAETNADPMYFFPTHPEYAAPHLEKYPLLEYDGAQDAVFSPADFDIPAVCPEKCVIAFSYDEVELLAKRLGAEKVDDMKTCTASLPLYRVNIEGEAIGLVCGFLGAAGAAAQLDELIHQGGRKFVVCGAAGSLLDAPLGALVLPERAVRDEGASFHYLPPSREIVADEAPLRAIAAVLKERGVAYTVGKTWTTDGLYRETPAKVALRRKEGCTVVEMEAAALMAVARFRGVQLGYILYCGDDMSGETYDHRAFFEAEDVRVRVASLALACCKRL